MVSDEQTGKDTGIICTAVADAELGDRTKSPNIFYHLHVIHTTCAEITSSITIGPHCIYVRNSQSRGSIAAHDPNPASQLSQAYPPLNSSPAF